MATINFFIHVLKHLATIFRTTEDAGRDLVVVSVDPGFGGKRGYVGRKSETAAEVSKDANVQQRLWKAC